MEISRFIFFVYCAAALGFFASCADHSKPANETLVPHNFQEEKIAANKEIVRRENADIELIAKRYNWNLAKTPSGLFYEILNKTDRQYPQTKDIVKLKGKMYLSDGTEIYNDKTDGMKEFVVNRSDEMAGLHELVKLMREGEKANAIIPSYLAYGISGDGEKIPAASFLICEIQLIKIN